MTRQNPVELPSGAIPRSEHAPLSSRTIDGPAITIHCTACGGRNVAATSYNHGEAADLFGVLRVSPYTSTNYVRCGNCRELFVTPIAIHELPWYSPEELSAYLRRRVSLIAQFFAVASLVLFFTPLGLALSSISLLLNWRRPGHWTWRASQISVTLALVAHAVFGVALLVEFLR